MPQTRVYALPAKSANAGEVVISGAFSVNGASDPVAFRGPDGLGTTLPAGITSITHSGTGEYTITFDDSFYAMTGAQVSLMLGAAADSDVQLTAIPANLNTTTAMTQKVTTMTAGAAANIAAASGNEVWFQFRFKRSMAK
jgi:hypothetical protein